MKMNSENKSRAIIVSIFLIVCAVIVTLSVVSMNSGMDTRSNASGNANTVETPITANYAPRLLNEPPIKATVGQQYNFVVKVVDSDTETSKLLTTLSINPSWLSYVNGVLTGTPSISDIGTHKVVFTMQDGENTVTKTFYIVVSE